MSTDIKTDIEEAVKLAHDEEGYMSFKQVMSKLETYNISTTLGELHLHRDCAEYVIDVATLDEGDRNACKKMLDDYSVSTEVVQNGRSTRDCVCKIKGEWSKNETFVLSVVLKNVFARAL